MDVKKQILDNLILTLDTTVSELKSRITSELDLNDLFKIDTELMELKTSYDRLLSSDIQLTSEELTKLKIKLVDLLDRVEHLLDTGAFKGGDKGDKGEQGVRGPQGLKGDKGETSLIPSISELSNNDLLTFFSFDKINKLSFFFLKSDFCDASLFDEKFPISVYFNKKMFRILGGLFKPQFFKFNVKLIPFFDKRSTVFFGVDFSTGKMLPFLLGDSGNIIFLAGKPKGLFYFDIVIFDYTEVMDIK